MEIAFGPYEPDIASVGTSKSSYVNNVVPRADGYGPIAAPVAFTSAMTGHCRGVAGALQSDGSTAIFGGNDTALYRVDATARTWSDVSVSGGYSVLTRELWDFAQFGNNVIATTSNNNPQVYTLGTSSLFAALGGSPPQARRVAVVGEFVVLAGLTANPNRIQWSSINDITAWTVGVDQCDYQDFPDGGFVQGIAGGEIGLVFQDRAIRRMVYQGPPLIFSFQRISEDRGVMMRYSICKAGGLTFFLSNDGFYKIDRSGEMTPIGANRVNRTVLAELDATDQRNMIGVADPVSQRVFWFYKTTAATYGVDTLDKVLIYDWALDLMSAADIAVTAAASVIPLSTTLESLDTVGTLDALPYSLDDYVSTFSSSLAVMSSDNKMCFLKGDNLEATLDTPEGQIGNGVRTYVRGLAPVGDSSAAMLSLRYRDRLIDPENVGVETAIGLRGYATMRQNARFSTARVRIPAGDTWNFIRSVDVDAKQVGVR